MRPKVINEKIEKGYAYGKQDYDIMPANPIYKSGPIVGAPPQGSFASLHIEYKGDYFTLVYDSEESGKISVFTTASHPDYDGPCDVGHVAAMRYFYIGDGGNLAPVTVEEHMLKLYTRLCNAYEL